MTIVSSLIEKEEQNVWLVLWISLKDAEGIGWFGRIRMSYGGQTEMKWEKSLRTEDSPG